MDDFLKSIVWSSLDKSNGNFYGNFYRIIVPRHFQK